MKNKLLLATLCTAISCTAPQRPTQSLPPIATPVPTPVAQPAPDILSRPAEILVIGDSQISFGAGAAYQSFFSNLQSACGISQGGWAKPKPAAIGVRSTSLQSWTTRDGPAKGTLCDVDEKFGVNAGTYGISSASGRSYVQIGADPDYPFCKPGKSGLQALFESPAYRSDLVVLAFLGNDADRWQSASLAAQDVTAAAAQIPAQTACVFLSTMPVYDSASNDKRSRAQANFAQAATTTRCAMVRGHTPTTRRAIEGNADYFRTNAEGDVIDTSHANEAAARMFVNLRTPALCAAVRAQTGQ
jgi:hypothetical protein